jgi:hypothetical protein
MCIIREKPKVTVHEDHVFPAETQRVIEYCEDLKSKGEIDVFDYDKPAKGLAWTLEHYLTRRLDSKYTFYLQEDWEFERPIDIDKITYIMDKNDDINLIFFNKIRNNGVINKQKQEQVDYEGYPFCVYHAWTFLPGIWRTDFVKKKWPKGVAFKPEAAFTNRFGPHEKRTPIGYCRENIGAYIYGGTGEHRYIRHLGNDWRMAKWQLKGKDKVRPGGNHGEHMDLPYMAPWVPYPNRPVQARGEF